MRALVVHAHPDPDSFNAQLCRAAVEALRGGGHQVDVLDLYALGVRAAMTTEERLAYESDEPLLDPMLREHAALLQAAELLVFVYPTWWWGMPAILKGWLERVMVPGVAFVLDDRSRMRGGLRSLRRVVGITTYGSRRPEMFVLNDAGRRIVNRCVRILAPPLRCRSTWLALYGLDTRTDAERRAFLERVRTAMGAR